MARARLAGQAEIVPTSDIRPPGTTQQQLNETNRRLIDESKPVAAVVGLRAAGYDVEITGQGAVRHVPFPPERQLIDIGSYYGSAAKIGAELGWRPRTPLREGLERTIRYYRDHLRHYL